MSFYRSKGFWIASVIFAPLLLAGVNYGVKVMTSVFKKDLGNGVVIYADDYVKTGRWIFDCEVSPFDQPCAAARANGRVQ